MNILKRTFILLIVLPMTFMGTELFSIQSDLVSKNEITSFLSNLASLEKLIMESTCNKIHKKIPLDKIGGLLQKITVEERESTFFSQEIEITTFLRNCNKKIDLYLKGMKVSEYSFARTEDLYEFKRYTENELGKILKKRPEKKLTLADKKHCGSLKKLKEALVDHVFDEEMIGFNGSFERFLFTITYKPYVFLKERDLFQADIQKQKKNITLGSIGVATVFSLWKLNNFLFNSIDNKIQNSTQPPVLFQNNSTNKPTKITIKPIVTCRDDSLHQGGERVANCAVYSAFHMEHFLKEEGGAFIDPPSREKEWDPFWNRYLQWVNDPETIKNYSPGEDENGNDFIGDFVDKGTISSFFRERNPSAHVYITGYNLTSGSELETIESEEHLVILKINGEVKDETFDYKEFIRDWYRLLNDHVNAKPIYCIVSNGGHFIAIKYYIKNGKISIDYRDSIGKSKAIAKHCYKMMDRLNTSGQLDRYYEATIPSLKVRYNSNKIGFIDYVKSQKKILSNSIDVQGSIKKSLYEDNKLKAHFEEMYVQCQNQTSNIKEKELHLIFYNEANKQEHIIRVLINSDNPLKEPIFITELDGSTDISKDHGYVWPVEMKKQLLEYYRLVAQKLELSPS